MYKEEAIFFKYTTASLNQRPSKSKADINTALKNTPISTVSAVARRIQHFHQPHSELSWVEVVKRTWNQTCLLLLVVNNSALLTLTPAWCPVPLRQGGAEGVRRRGAILNHTGFPHSQRQLPIVKEPGSLRSPSLYSLTIHVIRDLYGLFCCSGCRYSMKQQ